jgi:PAS domain S-box-containing protein
MSGNHTLHVIEKMAAKRSDKMNILIVDDKEEGRYLLETLLKASGHHVTAVANGVEAIEKLRSGGFDLIISDILMPVMDGFELCRKVKTDEALRRIPFIIYTATYTGPQDEAYALKIGADRFILKPCEPEVFLTAIKEVMAAAGRPDIASLQPLKEERETYRLYYGRLVKRLEDKMMQLEREIQARREAEKRAQTASERWQITFDSMLDPVALLKADGTIVQCNQAFADFLRQDAQALVGQKCYRLIHQTEGHIQDCPLLRALHTGTRETMELSFGEKTLYVVVDPIKAPEGQISGFLHILRDITERKRAEEELRKSEERFKQIAENAVEWIWEVDTRGLYTYASPMVENILGYRPEEVVGIKHFYDFFNTEDRERLKKAALEVFEGQRPFRNFVNQNVRKDGKTVWLSTSGVPFRDEKGNFLGYRGADTDITELKRAEEELKKSEEEYKNLVTTARDVIFTVYTDGTLASLNPAFHAITGLSVDDWIGKPFSLILHPDDLPLAMEKFSRALQGELNEVFELRVSTRLGGYVVGEFIIAPQIQNGKMVNILGIARDITERKRAEEALKESEGRLKELFDNAPVGYHEYDINGSITRINQTELEMLGYRLEEIIGRPVWSFIVEEEESKKAVLTKLAGAFPSGRQFERTYRRKDGTTFPALIEDRLLYDSEGKIVAIRSTIEDISERKKLEQEMVSLQEQLRQSQKMEAIGRLAGGIAHDFNNLLTVIKGNSQLSLLDLREGDPLKTNIEEIRKASERASDLIRQLLAFSRKQIMEMQILDINLILKRLDNMLHRVLGEDIELATILTEGIGKIKADPGQIEQVIVNLAVNSRDAMPDGGKLTIETANVELDEEYARKHIAVKPGQYVMLSVSDTGMGMTTEVQERVFEPFFTTKEIGKGTGLGLSTVYGIVKQSGGNIWVYSEAGKGTAFKIYLPQVDEPLTELKEVVSKGIPRGDETILIVEDEETVRKLAVRILKSLGYRVFEAPEGGRALILCEEFKGPIHLILTDVVMPGMSGPNLVERLRKIHPEMRVLYMSGYTDNAILHHGVLEKGTNFIQKPFTLENLARKVREVLDKV